MNDNTNLKSSFDAQDLAGKSILFEIGAQVGILGYIEEHSSIDIKDLSQKLDINHEFLSTYLETFENLGLLSKTTLINNVLYSKTEKFEIEKNRIGYISWGMVSCAPLVENTRDFLKDFNHAVRNHNRSGEHVARTSKWMGEKSFYPQAEAVITKLSPKKIVDLGSGTCGLLIRLAQKINKMEGIGVDLAKDACEKAITFIEELSLEDRIQVVLSPIQKLVTEGEEIFSNADVVHAGFVFHDLMPDEEEILDQLLATIRKISPKVTLVIVDAIPFSQNKHEQAFSSAFSILHKFFMGRKLLSESEWKNKLNKAGFCKVVIEPLGISGGRIFIANQ